MITVPDLATAQKTPGAIMVEATTPPKVYFLGDVLPIHCTVQAPDAALGRKPITLTGSPFVYTAAAQNQLVIVSGGTVSLIEYSSNGTVFDSVVALGGQFVVAAGHRLRVTYLVAPTITAYPL